MKTPKKLPFGGSHAPDCIYRLGHAAPCNCWRSGTKTFVVPVMKLQRLNGTIEVRASDARKAARRVKKMMARRKNPLQTNDSRISWDGPEYVDFTFDVAGEADEKQVD